MNAFEKIKHEKDIIKSEGWHYAAIIFAMALLILIMANYGTEPRWSNANADYTFEFNVDLPEDKYNIPWLVKRLELPNHSKEQEMYMNYAFALSKGDIRFPYKLKAENGDINQTTQSRCVDKNGKREPSFGFCQMHMQWYSSIINNPLFKSDWMWQMNECYKLWKGGTAMYGKVTQEVKASFKIL